MSNFLKEFREFAIKGSVVDLAVGVIIGGAFGKIVSSLVGDIVMPVLGLITGNYDFKSYKLGQVAIGNFIQSVVDFLIIALAIFIAIKLINRLRRAEEKKDNQKQ